MNNNNNVRIWLNNQYDYYTERLIEINLLQQSLEIEYALIVPLGITRIVGNVHCYEYPLAQKIIETLHSHNYPNIQYRLEHILKKVKNTKTNTIQYTKIQPYHTIYYSLNPIILSNWDTTSTKIKGTMFGYKHNIIF